MSTNGNRFNVLSSENDGSSEPTDSNSGSNPIPVIEPPLVSRPTSENRPGLRPTQVNQPVSEEIIFECWNLVQLDGSADLSEALMHYDYLSKLGPTSQLKERFFGDAVQQLLRFRDEVLARINIQRNKVIEIVLARADEILAQNFLNPVERLGFETVISDFRQVRSNPLFSRAGADTIFNCLSIATMKYDEASQNTAYVAPTPVQPTTPKQVRFSPTSTTPSTGPTPVRVSEGGMDPLKTRPLQPLSDTSQSGQGSSAAKFSINPNTSNSNMGTRREEQSTASTPVQPTTQSATSSTTQPPVVTKKTFNLSSTPSEISNPTTPAVQPVTTSSNSISNPSTPSPIDAGAKKVKESSNSRRSRRNRERKQLAQEQELGVSHASAPLAPIPTLTPEPARAPVPSPTHAAVVPKPIVTTIAVPKVQADLSMEEWPTMPVKKDTSNSNAAVAPVPSFGERYVRKSAAGSSLYFEEFTEMDDVIVSSAMRSGTPRNVYLEEIYSSEDNFVSEQIPLLNSTTSPFTNFVRTSRGSENSSEPVVALRSSSPIQDSLARAASAVGTPIRSAYRAVSSRISQSLSREITRSRSVSPPTSNRGIHTNEAISRFVSDAILSATKVPSTHLDFPKMVDNAQKKHDMQRDDLFVALSMNNRLRQKQMIIDRDMALRIQQEEYRNSNNHVDAVNADANKQSDFRDEQELKRGVLDEDDSHLNLRNPSRPAPSVTVEDSSLEVKDYEALRIEREERARIQEERQSAWIAAEQANQSRQQQQLNNVRFQTPLQQVQEDKDETIRKLRVQLDLARRPTPLGTPSSNDSLSRWAATRSPSDRQPRIDSRGNLAPPKKNDSAAMQKSSSKSIEQMYDEKYSGQKSQPNGDGDDGYDSSTDSNDDRDNKRAGGGHHSNPLHRPQDKKKNVRPSESPDSSPPDSDDGGADDSDNRERNRQRDSGDAKNPLHSKRPTVDVNMIHWASSTQQGGCNAAHNIILKMAVSNVRSGGDLKRESFDFSQLQLNDDERNIINTQLHYTPKYATFNFFEYDSLSIVMFEKMSSTIYSWVTSDFSHQPPNVFKMMNKVCQDQFVEKLLEIQTMIASGERHWIADSLVFAGQVESAETLMNMNFAYIMCKLSIVVTHVTSVTAFDHKLKEIVDNQFEKLKALSVDVMTAWHNFATFSTQFNNIRLDLEHRLHLLEFTSGYCIFNMHDRVKQRRYPFGLQLLIMGIFSKKNASMQAEYALDRLQFPPRTDGREHPTTQKARKIHSYVKLLKGYKTQFLQMSRMTVRNKILYQIFKEQSSRSSLTTISDKTLSITDSSASSSQQQRHAVQTKQQQSKGNPPVKVTGEKEKKRFYLSRHKNTGKYSLTMMQDIDTSDEDIQIINLDNDDTSMDVLLHTMGQGTMAEVYAMKQGTMEQFKPPTPGVSKTGDVKDKPICLLQLFHGKCTRLNCPFNHNDNRRVRQEVIDRWGRDLDGIPQHKLQYLQLSSTRDDVEEEADFAFMGDMEDENNFFHHDV